MAVDKKKLLYFHSRYKLEGCFDIGGFREYMKVALIGKDRIWACNGHVVVSIKLENVPEDAVGTVLTKEQLKYARNYARQQKEKFLVFKYGLTGMNSQDEEVPYLQYKDGEKEEVLNYDKEGVLRNIKMYAELIKRISDSEPFKEMDKITFSPEVLYMCLEGLGANVKKRENNDFSFKWVNNGDTKAVLIKCIVPSWQQVEPMENEKLVRKNIGVIAPITIDRKEYK